MHDLAEASNAEQDWHYSLHCATQFIHPGWRRARSTWVDRLVIASDWHNRSTARAPPQTAADMAAWYRFRAFHLRCDDVLSAGDDLLCSNLLLRFVRLDGAPVHDGRVHYGSIHRGARVHAAEKRHPTAREDFDPISAPGWIWLACGAQRLTLQSCASTSAPN